MSFIILKRRHARFRTVRLHVNILAVIWNDGFGVMLKSLRLQMMSKQTKAVQLEDTETGAQQNG
jgi:hypothetical protein